MADKQWVLHVVSPASGQLAVLRDGTALPSEIGPGATTPVELLLASMGTCFALSCWAAFASQGLERVGFEVRVIGRKAAQPPSRLSSINLGVTFDVSLPLVKAQAVIASAERLCTVTNTMTFEPPCAIEVYVANGGGRNEAATFQDLVPTRLSSWPCLLRSPSKWRKDGAPASAPIGSRGAYELRTKT